MSNLDSWEDESQGQEEKLAQQTQQMNIRGGAPQTFHPGASSFTPGAQSFQPYQQQYGGGYPQGNYAQQNWQNNYYQPQGYSQQQFNQPYAYNSNQQQNYQGQQFQPQSIAKRGERLPGAAAPASNGNAAPPPKAKVLSIGGDSSAKGQAPKAKVLSIGGDSPAKVEAAGNTKVLSIGTPAPTASATPSVKNNINKEAPEAGTKVAAAKAMEKSEPDTASSPKSSSGKASPTGRSSPSRAEQREAARQAETVTREQEADVDEETLKGMYGKEHVNVIFLGHVDAGKSTLGGSILYATGMVDERTMDKYKRDAKEAGRESWYLSWALDLTKEERSKGKTVEVGRGFFETEKRRYSILDAPGHKTFVPNMIGGASQADVGVLVISARKGEYETGFEKGGQTREHAVLAKTQGVNKLVVVVNKMDDPTVEWSEERYGVCTQRLTAFLKSVGYNPKTDVTYMPISAQTGVGIKNRVPKDVAPWYDGPSLLEYLDDMQSLERKINAPFMMPVAAKYRDLGTMCEGRIESGVIKKGQSLLMMPNRESVSVSALYGETEDEIEAASCGEQVRIRLRGIEEEDILQGFVLCSPKRPVHCVSQFEAQIVLLELNSVLSAGFNCVLHVHAAQEEVTFDALLHKLEPKTNRKSKKPPGFVTKGMGIIARLKVTGAAGHLCVERFEDYPQLGRFTLRDQGVTIGIGKITKLITDAPAA